jgi:hypothetical protein
MAGWQIDDQPPDLALPYRRQLGGNHVDVPVHRKCRLRIELGKTALSKKGQIRPQDCVVFGEQKVFHHWFTLSRPGTGP